MKSRVVITGLGMVSAIGAGGGYCWQALANGRNGIMPISMFNTSELPFKKAAEVTDFRIRDYVTHKGVNGFSRSAQFVCAAASIALKEADVESLPPNRTEVGIVLGTAFGSARCMEAFDEECMRDGNRFVDPMSFPKTVANSPAGCLSVLTGVAGPNVTVSTDFASGLGAVEYAANLVASGQMRMVLAGGYDELSLASHIEMSKAGLLSSARRIACCSVPLDRRRSGFYLGEGAGVLLLERREDALARQAPIIAELGGFGTSSCLDPGQAMKSQCRAMTEALEDAGLRAEDIDYVSASANGSVAGDRHERLALERVFGSRANNLPVTAIKSMIGECGGAAGAIQLIAASLSTRYDAVTPTVGFEEAEPGSLLRNIICARRAASCNAVLVNSFNGQHTNSSAVVKKFLN